MGTHEARHQSGPLKDGVVLLMIAKSQQASLLLAKPGFAIIKAASFQ